jgi:hypothetical protein
MTATQYSPNVENVSNSSPLFKWPPTYVFLTLIQTIKPVQTTLISIFKGEGELG